MREFFKPWRRKAGVMMLGLALVLMGSWVRSYDSLEQLRFRYPSFAIGHACGVVYIVSYPAMPNRPFVESQWIHHYRRVQQRQGNTKAYPLRLFSGGGYISHTVLVLFTTLLSAYLLLSKSRPPAPNTTEPAPTTGV